MPPHCVWSRSRPDAIRAGRLPAFQDGHDGVSTTTLPAPDPDQVHHHHDRSYLDHYHGSPGHHTGLPSTSRRRLLTGSVFGAALATIGLPAKVSAAQPDPILALYAKWRALEDTIAVQEAQHRELRQAMVTVHGEPMEGSANYAAWIADPRHSALGQATGEINALCDQSTDLLDEMTETPATSLQGIQCKLLATVSALKFIENPTVEAEYHDTMALAVMRDAVRVLGGSALA